MVWLMDHRKYWAIEKLAMLFSKRTPEASSTVLASTAGYYSTQIGGLALVTMTVSQEGVRAFRAARAEQRLRMCIDGRGLGSNLVSFSKGISKHPHFLAIIKVDSEYLRFSFKLKVDYFILYWILVSTLVIFLLLFSMSKRRRTNEASLQ